MADNTPPETRASHPSALSGGKILGMPKPVALGLAAAAAFVLYEFIQGRKKSQQQTGTGKGGGNHPYGGHPGGGEYHFTRWYRDHHNHGGG